MNYDDLADLYDHQYDVYRDDLHFYGSVTEKTNGTVLEIGAGTGRVTAFLARRGVQVIGLEPSARMIERGQQRAKQDQVDLHFVQGNAQSFTLDQRFPLIIAPFNSLMHLYTAQEQLAALKNIHTHLAPNGQLIFDLYVPRFGSTETMRHEGETFYQPDGSRTDVFLVQRHDALKQRMTTEYYADTTGPTGALTRQHYTLTQRYYTRYEMEWLLRCAGFSTPTIKGSFQGGPLDLNSEVMVFSVGH